MLTISSGYDPGYLTRAVATGRENYYLSAVAEHGEPPGIWTGRGCPELGLSIGSEVDNKVMERLYGAFIDPHDPEHQATLGRAPSGFGGKNDKLAAPAGWSGGLPAGADRLPAQSYGEGVKLTISWLLGDRVAPPVDSAGRGPYTPKSQVHAVLHNDQNKQQ
jgi:hypothetical protein